MSASKADKLNILLVDDQAQKLLAYEAMLDGLGENLIRATSGAQAFEILLQEEIAVILLDVNMPGMNGFETASAIRDHPRFAKTPIIFVTAVNTTDLDRIRGYKIGAVDYVAVPVIPEILCAKVSVFVELHRKNQELERLNKLKLRRFRALVEQSSDVVVLMDDALKVTYVSPSIGRVLDRTEDEFLGRRPFDFVHEEDLPGCSLRLTELLAMPGSTADFTARFQRADGSWRWLEAACTNLLMERDVQAVVGSFRDITPRKLAEEKLNWLNENLEKQVVDRTRALTESKGRLRAVLDSANDAIITIDAAGIIQTVNPATERIFGYSASEIIGKNVKLLMPTPYQDDHDGFLQTYARTGLKRIIGVNREVQGLRKDNSLVPLELAVSEVIPGQVYTGILRDISSRKDLEREVTEIATREQRRIGQDLHDGVSQELAGLTMMAANLAEQLEAEGVASKDLAVRIMAGLRQGPQKHVRAVSHGLVPVDVDAEGLRAALEELAAHIHEHAGIACVFRCPPRALVGDTYTATHLFHIVQEAVNNAVRHSKATRIEIMLHFRPDALVLNVHDDGVGIAIDETKRLGVGLRLMHHRSSLIGGVLQIRADSDRGTQVTCTIPRIRHGAVEPMDKRGMPAPRVVES